MYPNGYYTHISTSLDSEFVQALIQIEDKNYYEHWGVNLPAKLRALRDNIVWKRVSGGSTITEQYVKNKYFKTAKRSYLQKAREAILAVYFSLPHRGRCLSDNEDGGSKFLKQKNHILNIYYHDAYFGNQLYGVGAALEVYFGKNDLDDLTQEEIVILISLIHNPGIQSLEEQYFREYFEQVKKRLGYEFERTYFGTLPKKENKDRFPFVTQNYIKYPVDQTMTIDAQLQEFSRNILQETLKGLQGKHVTNGAIFAMNPKTREVLIYQGSKDFYATDIDGQVDVIRSLRQPGSTMKPFLYLQALESWAGTESLILDIESQYNSFKEGKTYISENYSLKEYGLVRLKKALGNSFNNAAVRLALELGLQNVYEFYESYGFHFPYDAEHYGYSLVLGNPSIRLEDVVRSYAKLLPTTEDINKFLLYDILSDPDNRDVSFGVNSILNTSISQAVKTGTSSDFRDNLVISYHPDLVVWVWVGNNDNSSMKWVTGITGAGYIWHQVIEKAIDLGYITNTKIPIPEGIEKTEYCLTTSCSRKEMHYQKTGKKYFSRLVDNIFDSRDIFETMSAYEKTQLRELWVDIK